MHAGQPVTAGLCNGVYHWNGSRLRLAASGTSIEWYKQREKDFCGDDVLWRRLMSPHFISSSVVGYGDQRHAVHCNGVRKEWRNVWWVPPLFVPCVGKRTGADSLNLTWNIFKMVSPFRPFDLKRPHERSWCPKEVLADSDSCWLLPPAPHRSPWPKNWESAAGRKHEHQTGW